MATTLIPEIQEQTAQKPGRFGAYGGRYVPETLMAALEELELAYAAAQADPEFQAELANDPKNVQSMLYLADADIQMDRVSEAAPLL